MALLGISLIKLGRRRASWIILLMAVALTALFFLGLAASTSEIAASGDELQVRLMLSFPTAYIFLVGMVLTVGGMLALVYGAAAIGIEWSSGTIRTVVARGESRIRFTFISFLAVALALLVGLVILFAVGIVLAIASASIAGYGTEGATDEAMLRRFPDLIARSWLGIVTHAAVGFAIAMVARSQLAGIVVGLVLYFSGLFLPLVPIIDDIVPYLPFNVANAVVAPIEGLDSGGFGEIGSVDSDLAVVLALAWVAATLGIASLAAWRAQITQ